MSENKSNKLFEIYIYIFYDTDEVISVVVNSHHTKKSK